MDITLLLQAFTKENLIVGAVLAAWWFDRRRLAAEAQQYQGVIMQLTNSIQETSRAQMDVITGVRRVAESITPAKGGDS